MNKDTELYAKLLKIQGALNVPKSNYNEFGGFNYRSCEDILEGLKPILAEHKAVVAITDEIVQIGERYYVKATAELIDTENGTVINTTAYAREEETKKGMDGSQITGSASSYARKYALNGLFAIDDTKDADDPSRHDSGSQRKPARKSKPSQSPTQSPIDEEPMLECNNCGKKLTQGVSVFSKTKYGKELCVDCQKLQK